MVTLEDVQALSSELSEALVGHQKWSPYALNALYEEYAATITAYANQEGITAEEVEALLPAFPPPTPDITR